MGTLVVLGSVLGGFMRGGSNVLLLWHPPEVVILCGAALGAFLISNPLKVVKDAFTGAPGLAKGARCGRQEYIQLLKRIDDILVMTKPAEEAALSTDAPTPVEQAAPPAANPAD